MRSVLVPFLILISVYCYSQDGTIDKSFGNSGSFTIPSTEITSSFPFIAIQPDFKIIVAGSVYTGNGQQQALKLQGYYQMAD